MQISLAMSLFVESVVALATAGTGIKLEICEMSLHIGQKKRNYQYFKETMI